MAANIDQNAARVRSDLEGILADRIAEIDQELNDPKLSFADRSALANEQSELRAQLAFKTRSQP